MGRLYAYTEAALRRERMSERDESDRVFFYVDGIPTKGRWIALEEIDSWADVHLTLQAAGLVNGVVSEFGK